MIKCKITVLRRSLNQDLINEYVEPDRRTTLGPCEVFKEGQEFLTDVFGEIPRGFCPWAWDDIYKALVGFASGGNFGMRYERKDCLIACCTDGTRPVIFKIEKIDEELKYA
jgi:uncharacterized repeat protein (TIGR04076 family)